MAKHATADQVTLILERQRRAIGFLNTACKVLEQIASMKRKTEAQRLASATMGFLESQGVDEFRYPTEGN